jgi:hypothetical protein
VTVFGQDFFAFKKLILPVLIQIIFWIGVALVVIWAFSIFALAGEDEWQVAFGVGVLLIGPIFVRIYCEVLVVAFRINETLTDIRRDISKLVPQAVPDRKVCGECGKESQATARFCPDCGEPL